MFVYNNALIVNFRCLSGRSCAGTVGAGRSCGCGLHGLGPVHAHGFGAALDCVPDGDALCELWPSEPWRPW